MMKTRKSLFLLLVGILPFLSSCSINKMVINKVSDALTGSGSSDVFTGDSDPQLVGDAIPFAIKMYESLLAQNPEHSGLLLTTGSLFVMYANAFVQGPADMMGLDQFDEREAAKVRAKNFYIRGTEILYRGLDKKFPGDKKTPKFSEATVEAGTLAPILQKMKKDDVALLYWTVAGGLSAYAIDVFDFALGVRIPEMGAMIARAYELDPDFNNGALDEFYILFYSALPEALGGNKALAEEHYKKALAKTKGQSAGTYVAYAQSVCVPAQDYETYKANLEKALDVDVDAEPANRLVNIINQRKARYMLDEAYNYFSFLDYDDYDDWDY
jgi:predicted anti-sigma-YlaC factor YlaD